MSIKSIWEKKAGKTLKKYPPIGITAAMKSNYNQEDDYSLDMKTIFKVINDGC